MAALASILNHHPTAGQAQPSVAATPMTAATGSTGSTDTSSTTSATISANDFLSLLVTEMQNQDPTASTDPNEYINQLVQVNSLEQLISINQSITGALGTTTTGGTGGVASQVANGSATPALAGAASQVNATTVRGESFPSTPSASGGAPTTGQTAQTALAKLVPGNLDVPTSSAAAERIARSLDGRIHAAGLQ